MKPWKYGKKHRTNGKQLVGYNIKKGLRKQTFNKLFELYLVREKFFIIARGAKDKSEIRTRPSLFGFWDN